MVGDHRRQWPVRQDVKKVQPDVQMVGQEVERRVGHQVAGADQRQQPQGRPFHRGHGRLSMRLPSVDGHARIMRWPAQRHGRAWLAGHDADGIAASRRGRLLEPVRDGTAPAIR